MVFPYDLGEPESLVDRFWREMSGGALRLLNRHYEKSLRGFFSKIRRKNTARVLGILADDCPAPQLPVVSALLLDGAD